MYAGLDLELHAVVDRTWRYLVSVGDLPCILLIESTIFRNFKWMICSPIFAE